MKNFDRLFSPRSIAVIGASQDLTSISGQPIAHLMARQYSGAIYPVNPRYTDVAGLRCYPGIAALPATPDVAVVAVAARRVPETMRELAECHVPFAVVLSSGYAESGEQGRDAQTALARQAADGDVLLVGPNCQGYMNIADAIPVGFGAPYGLSYRRGGVSLTSQSGAFGNSILMLANEEGLGFHRYVSTGNEAVVTSLDLFEYFLGDPGTKVIAGYVEGFKDAHRLVALGREALRKAKPIVVWKVGTSDAGAKAAASHTANLGGATALYRAAFRQAGIIEANDVGDMADCAKALLPGRLPKGNRIAIATISGGAGIAMADKCAESGLVLPELQPSTIEGLRKVLPGYASIANPLDVTGSLLADANLMTATLEALARDTNVDMIGLALAAASGKLATQLAQEIVRISDETKVPILVAWNADASSAADAYRILDEAGIPRYQSPVRCARGAGVLWQRARATQRLAEIDREKPLSISRPAVKERLQGRSGDLTEYEAKQVLAEYGIGVTTEALASRPENAASLAAVIGFPVVMKIMSPDIPHKTEAGGVRIGVADDEQAKAVYDELVANARRFAPEARIDGVLIQEMVSGGTEVILGVNNDPLFGPAVMAGLGGVYAEVLHDVSFRLAPITLSEAHEMLRELRTFAILDGARGKPKCDIDELAVTLTRLSALAIDLKDHVAELDLNPLFVLPKGKGVRAGDALIKLKR